MRFYTWKELKLIVRYSRQYLYELEAREEFPERIRQGRRRVVWDAAEVERWIESKRKPK